MKRRLWTLIALLLFIAVTGWAFYPKPAEVEIVTLRRGNFERRVEEDGLARLRDRFVLSAPVAGRLARVTLREGDWVRPGQPVATLWPVPPALLDARREQEQREQVAAAGAALQRAQAGVARAQLALTQSEADLRRERQLGDRGFVSRARVDDAATRVQLRQRELEAAQQEAAAARHQQAQLRVALQQAADPRALARPLPVYSPVAGKVLRVRQQSEAVLAAGTPLIEVGDPARMEVLVDLLTEDAARVAPGTLATLSDWGGNTTLEARVRRIEPSAFTKVSALGVEEQRVNVLLDLVSPASQWTSLGDHYKISVSIPVQAAADVTLAPVGALFPRGSRSALFVVNDGRARLHEVTLMARNGREAWIETALSPGTSVIVYPPNSLEDGDRVRALAAQNPAGQAR